MLDLDGTTIPNSIEGMPSENVTNAIKNASKILKVGVATSRPHKWTDHIIKHLQLSSPSIVDGGAQVIDPKSGTVLWQQAMIMEDVYEIFNIAEKNKCQFNYSDGDSHDTFDKHDISEKVFNIFLRNLTLVQSNKLIEEISNISTVSIHKVPPWKGDVPNLNVMHVAASKQHAMLKVAEVLKIETHEIIGVGDGYNDFPLLMACGLKIAMGNAVSELKEIADYIAPSVDDDGVAWVIDKFILNS